MNSKIALTLLAAVISSTAMADDITPEPSFTGHLSRADVLVELAQFKAGGVNPWSISYNPVRGFQSEVAREQVRQEFIAAREQVRAFTSEDSGSGFLAGVSVPEPIRSPAGTQTESTAIRGRSM